MTLNDFLPLILPRAKGCPDILATFNTRLAIIELCRKSLIWREYLEPVATMELTTAYEYNVDPEQQVCKLLSLTLNGNDVDVVDPEAGKNRLSGQFAYGGLSGFELRPAQEPDLDIVTYCAVAPSLTANYIPDSMAQYMEAIAQGALSRILVANGKEYGDIAGAGIAKELWNEAIADAKADALTGFSRTTIRTHKVWF